MRGQATDTAQEILSVRVELFVGVVAFGLGFFGFCCWGGGGLCLFVFPHCQSGQTSKQTRREGCVIFILVAIQHFTKVLSNMIQSNLFRAES